MAHTEALADNALDLADDWTPSDDDWNWYWSVTSDDFAENVMW